MDPLVAVFEKVIGFDGVGVVRGAGTTIVSSRFTVPPHIRASLRAAAVYEYSQLHGEEPDLGVLVVIHDQGTWLL